MVKRAQGELRNSVELNAIHGRDCIEGMNAVPAGSVDLAFADPPFNIGYEYDVYDDRQQRDAYLDWSRRWMAGVHRVLKPDGTFWLAIGDEYAAELKLIAQDIGFHCRSWVIWYYTFGVNCKQKFSRSHAHLFYFVKDAQKFTFRGEELENRIPSARQLVYADARANPAGRLPDDTWVLRPQDLSDCFTTGEDTWYLPRVAGTFKERAGFHGCQMPEQLLGRIVRLCSAPGELVFDPFSGSATTVAVAKKLGRRYLAFELSEEYVARGTARLAGICAGDPLDGSAEPTMSAPATGVKGQKSKPRAAVTIEPPDADAANGHLKLLRAGLVEAFRRSYDGFSLDRLVADPELNARLADACRELGLPGEPRTWNWTLFGMRKAGLLADLPATRRTELDWDACDPYLFASEIAWRQMIDNGYETLDHILCDPFLAAEFDAIARRWAPGFRPLEYRWAAMKLRKSAKRVHARAEMLGDAQFGPEIPLDKNSGRKFPKQSGIYVVADANRRALYAGEANDLRQRVESQLISSQARPLWKSFGALAVRYFPTECGYVDRLAYQCRLVVKHTPELNLQRWKTACA